MRSEIDDFEIEQQVKQHQRLISYAFPGKQMIFNGRSEELVDTQGLTKRELFAAMAMQGFISAGFDDINTPKVVEWSVMYADALTKELNKAP